MNYLGLYDGCHVQLMNGQVKGPLKRVSWSDNFPWRFPEQDRLWVWSDNGQCGSGNEFSIERVLPPHKISLSSEYGKIGTPERISEHVLAAAREAGLKAKPAYDEFVAAIVTAAFQAIDTPTDPLLKTATDKPTFSENELLDTISVALSDNVPFVDRSEKHQERIRGVAANVMRLIEGAQNESAPEIRPSEKTEGGQSDPLFRTLDKLHPATRAFLQAIYPHAPLRAVEAPNDFVLLADYGRPGKGVAHIRLSVEAHSTAAFPKIPLWIEDDGTYRPGSHPAAVEALIEGER